MPSRWITALAAALAAACITTASTATAASACGPAGYAYAGVQSPRNGFGISARITSLALPEVASGHVAGWVGVGAPGEGPSGSDSWIQVGLNSLPGTGNTLYYEITRPFQGTTYHEVARDVPSGRALKLAVLEVSGQRDHWRVWVDGRAVSPPVRLVGSHGRLTPMAMAESWDGGRRVCNRYAYRFAEVSLATAPGGAWQVVRESVVLQDHGFKLDRTSASAFVAATAGMQLPRQAPAAAAAPSAPAESAAPKRQTPQAARVVTVQPIQRAGAKPAAKPEPKPAAQPEPKPQAAQAPAKPAAPAAATATSVAPAQKPSPAATAPVAVVEAAPAAGEPVAIGPAVAVAGDAQGNEIALRLIVSLLSAW